MASDPTEQTAAATPVWIRWWRSDPGPPLHGALVQILTAPSRLGRRASEGPAGTWVAVWPPEAAAGSTPVLVVKVGDESLPAAGGKGSAVVLGELAPNGALCLVVDGRRIRPIFNPLAPTPPLLRAAGRR
jgi:hypothetical protein